MGKIAYSVSSIGLGHASRAVAVGTELKKRGHQVIFFTNGIAAEFLKAYNFPVRKEVSHPLPWVVSGNMILPSVWYARYWFHYRISKERMKNSLKKLKPDVVVCDEEFSSLVAGKELKMKKVVISDEFYLSFANSFFSRILERKIQGWYNSVLSSADMILVPDEGVSMGKTFYVGRIVREVRGSIESIRMKYGLPVNSRVILFSMTGSKLGNYLLRKTILTFRKIKQKGIVLVISGSEWYSKDDDVRVLGFVRDNHELIFASDIVITTAGKSTIDEALAFGTPIVAIPIKGHSEQERNAKDIGYTFNDIEKLKELITDKIGKRKEPLKAEGAIKATSLIEELMNQ
jgi:UDP-N-acetylglucosamine--N-acetylmuramyl-(pentapeptide) pyrophosphoryl-undecaprenol N-acetylglucosamine transferase